MNYSKSSTVKDLHRLMPYVHGELVSMGCLCTCVYCGCEVYPRSGYTFSASEVDTDGAWIMASCAKCGADANASKPWMDGAKGLVISDDEKTRKQMISSLRAIAIKEVTAVVGYPVIMQPLIIDGGAWKAALITEEATYSTFAPWSDNDPLIVGGKFARDADVLRKSIQSGKTRVSLVGGSALIESDDLQLISALAKG